MAKSDSGVIEERFRLAYRFLNTAKLNVKDGDLRSAADRAYYAMFHAAAAALHKKGIKAKSHRGIIQKFGEAYIKTDEFDRQLGKALQRAFSLRQASDYEVYPEPDEEQVTVMMEKAQEFVKKLKELLGVG